MNKFANVRKFVSFTLLIAFALLNITPLRAQIERDATNFDSRNSKSADWENYDIRLDKSAAARAAMENYRTAAGRESSFAGAVREKFGAAENRLRQRIPTLKVEYNDALRVPEVIGLDVGILESGERLAARSGKKTSNAETLRQFIFDNNELIGLRAANIGALKTVADYTNPDGVLSYAHLEQTINGVPVFQAEIKAGFNRRGEMFRVINNLAPALEYDSLSSNFGDAGNAVGNAFKYVSREIKAEDYEFNQAESTDLKAVFGTGDAATTAEKMYFPIEAGTARTAWRVLVWEPARAFYVIVDAETGVILWRKNISNDQTQTATYNVYTNPANMLNLANNPAPIVPGLNTPNSGTQGALISRNNVTLIGNEAPNTFNNLGWITDGANGANGFTDGNNVQAGLDIDGTNGVDAPVSGTNRVFNFAYTPNTDSPTLSAYRNGAVTQLFYTTNRYHDELYKLGFTEAARNFQNDNFGRGGTANDRVSAEAQDSSGTNNANFGTPADGGRGRMQMYIFPGPNPDLDGDLDNDVVVHELTHGLSNRLVGNAAGLSGNRGGSMGEGWSDFYGLALLSNPADPLAANYATGGYATYLLTAGYTYNYYYGIRRFPYAIKSFTGGPNNRPHNPLTFADIDPAQINVSDGAFAANPVFAPNGATEVHNAGEVWCVALWEVRAQLINRLGGANGNLKSLQLVTDGLKLTPNSPNFIQARDAIIAAANATAAADAVDVREGFRIRGMGSGAQDNGTSVVESFAIPNVELTDPFTVSDSSGDNDGFPEPGENVLLSVAITNTTGATVNSVAANVNGGTNVAYGNIANAATVTMQIPYTVPAGAVCGSLHSVTINISSAAGTIAPQTRSFRLGVPVFGSGAQNFDGVTAPTLPIGWTQTNSGANTGWVTTTVNAVSAPNSVFAPDPAADGEATLETSANITSASAQLSFSNRFDVEPNFDGSVLEIRIGNGAYQDILAAGGSFASGGYTRALSGNTPLGTRQTWTGSNGTGFTTLVNLPAAANGQTIGLRWRTVSDQSVSLTGTWYDNMQLTGGNFQTGYLCNISTNLVVTTAADTNDGVCNADCSLREALDVADGDNVNDVITFNIPANSANCVGANCTITLTSPLAPSADGGLLTTIDGNSGANVITLSGNGATQILNVGSGVNLAANNLNFTRGSGGVTGGATLNSGTLTLTNSALYVNSAGNGGAIYNNSGGQLNLTNVTVSGNSAGSIGGGIFNNGTVTATNCTIISNSAQFEGGVFGADASTPFTLRNTIIAGNTASFSPDANGNFTSNGYNLIGNASGANGFNQTGDQTGINPMLSILGSNGGKTMTHALLMGSPAIDKGNSFGSTTDQRGLTRPIDLPNANYPNATGGNGADIGAFEAQTTANFSIGGTVGYGTDAAKFVPGVSLTAAGTPSAMTTTDSGGIYSLNGLGATAYTVTPSKATQTDNTGISVQDASEVAKYVFNQRTFTANQLIAADATGNGTVSVQDASEIAKRTFNNTSTNIVGQWKFTPAARSYPSLTANLTGQDYAAILIGDVTGNWTPPSSFNRFESETTETEFATSENPLFGNQPFIDQLFGNAKAGLLFKDGQNKLPTEDKQAREQQSEKTQASGGIAVSLPNASGSSGATVLIPVTVGNLSGQNVSAYDLTVSFDPNILQPASPAYETSGTLTGAAGGYTPLVDSTQPSGRLRTGAFGITPLSGSGTLIFLRFTVIGNGAATSMLNFENFRFGEGTPQAITTNGSFMRLGPTAASISINGRVLVGTRGLLNATVTLTDANGNSRTARTNGFGYYHFNDVAAGQTCIISVQAKRYQFPTQVVNIGEDVNELNFYGSYADLNYLYQVNNQP